MSAFDHRIPIGEARLTSNWAQHLTFPCDDTGFPCDRQSGPRQVRGDAFTEPPRAKGKRKIHQPKPRRMNSESKRGMD